MWVKETELEDFDIEDENRFQQLKAWGRQHNKCGHASSSVSCEPILQLCRGHSLLSPLLKNDGEPDLRSSRGSCK